MIVDQSSALHDSEKERRDAEQKRHRLKAGAFSVFRKQADLSGKRLLQIRQALKRRIADQNFTVLRESGLCRTGKRFLLCVF